MGKSQSALKRCGGFKRCPSCGRANLIRDIDFGVDVHQPDHRHRLCLDCRNGAARLSRMMKCFGIEESDPERERLRLQSVAAKRTA